MAHAVGSADSGLEEAERDVGEEFTVMLRGIACRLAHEDVKTLLDAAGLRGKFSSIYVPCVAAQRSNLGYGFVRFRSEAYARECHDLIHGRPLGPSGPGKVCEVVVARRQEKWPAMAKRHRRPSADGQALICDDPIELSVVRTCDFAAACRSLAPSSADSTGRPPSSASSASSRSSWPSSPEDGAQSPAAALRIPFQASSCISSTSDIFEDHEVETLFEEKSRPHGSRAE